MQPEISRRCLSCGASVPAGSMFCPECGQPLLAPDQVESSPEHSAEAASVPNRAAPEQAVDESPAANEFAPEASAEETPATSKTLPAPEPVEIAGVPAAVSENSETVAEEKPQIFPVAAEAPAERQRAGAARETLHRASAAARGAIEDNVKRVEKIRHVSTVVLEEASYDASLRFVLVAVALFLLVAVILFVSKVMG